MKKMAGFLTLVACLCRGADPGPPTGGGINRTYDDGYVMVDITENEGGQTWYWGYQQASQVAGDTIQFHATTIIGNVVTVITDTYDLGGSVPPAAPYFGTEFGPGPLISDEPARTTTIITAPVLKTSLSNAQVVITWAGLTNAVLEATASLSNAPSATVWNTVTNAVTISADQVRLVLAPAAEKRFFRLRFP
jgi:hypothetical protein